MTSTPSGEHVTESQGGASNRTSSPPGNAAETPGCSNTSIHYYDNVTVALVPEKKGLFLKHSEYEVFMVQ